MADANSTAIPARMQNRKRPLPPLADLLAEADRVYEYRDDGNLYWKALTNPKRKGWPVIGSVAGGNDGHGYKMCLLLGHKFKVHQIVWLINYREFPCMPIDHIDCDKQNNKIENLRLAQDWQNTSNFRKGDQRTFEYVKGKFVSRIAHLGKKLYLGRFPTLEEARDAYNKASRELRGEFSPV